MNTTRSTLIMRIKDPRDTEAWAQFHDLYAPLIYRYARSRGLSQADSEDMRSKCYEAIIQQINTFEYDKAKGGFKAWLRTIVNRRVADLLRKRREVQAGSQQLHQQPSNEASPEEIWERQWELHHLRYCVEQVKGRVTQQNFEAFTLLVLEGRSVEEVCHQLGITPNQAYKARTRVIRLVREKLAEIGLGDSEM